MSCMRDTDAFAFCFHTPTFFTTVRISWNSWPLFSRWLQSCDVCLRLGSRVCVCLFCFLLCCFVCCRVGWQQHCRSIVINAMVYPKSWKSEDKSGTGKTLKSMDWVWIPTAGYKDLYLQHCKSWRSSWLELRGVLLSSLNWRIHFLFGAYDIEYELNEMSFGWCFIINLLFWKSDVFFFHYFWSRMWSRPRDIFLNPVWTQDWTSVQCSEMGCHVERGCESWSPYGWPVRVTYRWRHVILHRERPPRVRFWYNFVHGRLVDNIQYVVGKVCAFDLQFGHDILLSFESAVFYDTQNVSDRCWAGMWRIDQFYILFRILLESGTAVGGLKLKVPTLVWHCDFRACLRHWAVWSLQVMRAYSWKLWEKSLD